MSPTWRTDRYVCPDCGGSTESAGGPDGLHAVRCSECDWERCYDPAADEFAVQELERRDQA
ncbi:hypothetical protein ACOZ4F_14270 [Haloarcula marismortui]|uniref:hypothetical protein n=1 Tax=Haloarcula marismortui TaxID=2238 RepID=UPI003C75AB59